MAPAEKRQLLYELAPLGSATFFMLVVACQRGPGDLHVCLGLAASFPPSSAGTSKLTIPGTLEAKLALSFPPVACLQSMSSASLFVKHGHTLHYR